MPFKQMIWRQTFDDEEALDFAKVTLNETSMRKELAESQIIRPKNARIVFRRVLMANPPAKRFRLGLVFLFDGFEKESENGWSAVMADQVQPDELEETLMKMLEIEKAILKDTEYLNFEKAWGNLFK
jgi:hypothetical protein